MTTSSQKSPLSELNDFTYVYEPDADAAYTKLALFIDDLRKGGMAPRYIREAMLPQMLDLAASELVRPDREKLLDDLQFVNYAVELALRRREQLVRQYERHFGETSDDSSTSA